MKESENESSDYYFSDKSDSENIDVLVIVNFWIIELAWNTFFLTYVARNKSDTGIQTEDDLLW